MADNFSVVLEGLYIDSDIPFSLYIADVTVNAIFSAIAILGNTFVIVALWKLSPFQVHPVFKAFLLSLALGDLGVGVVVQPLYIASVVTAINGQLKASRTIGAIFYFVNWFVPFISLATLTLIALDRYLALHFRVRYRLMVTAKRVVCLLILLSVLTIAGTTLIFWNHNVYNAFANAILALFLFLTTASYLKIYVTLRHQEGRWNHKIAPTLEMRPRNCTASKMHTGFNLARYKRSVNNMLLVYVTFILCYLPLFCIMIVIQVRGVNRTTKISRFISATLIFVNSSLNPILYCWKIREIRQMVWIAIAKPFFCCDKN